MMECGNTSGVENCYRCMEFVTTCDRCHSPGHTDSDGWYGIEMENGQPRVLCEDCFHIESD
jgi:hypothetical protein